MHFMLRYIRPLILLFVVTSYSLVSEAQDQIIKRDGKIIICKVVKMGTQEITYTIPEYDHTVKFLIDKSKVEKVVFENGKEIIIDHIEIAKESIETHSADLFLVQKRNTIKLDFINILLGTTGISYERALKPGRTCEFELGLIGLGLSDDALGLGLKAGYKLFVAPEFYLKRIE